MKKLYNNLNKSKYWNSHAPNLAAELAANLHGYFGDHRLGLVHVLRVEYIRGDHLARHAEFDATRALDGVVRVLVCVGHDTNDQLRIAVLDHRTNRVREDATHRTSNIGQFDSIAYHF